MFFLIILNILINSLLLTVVIILGAAFTGAKHFPPQGKFFTLITIITALITLFGITPIGKYITKLILNTRNALPNEQEYLTPILNKEKKKFQQIYLKINTRFNISHIMLNMLQ